jgi:hypothetical protein
MTYPLADVFARTIPKANCNTRIILYFFGERSFRSIPALSTGDGGGEHEAWLWIPWRRQCKVYKIPCSPHIRLE